MVIGKGLIATALSEFEHNDHVLIFASGVSNSSEILEESFDREKALLLSTINSNKKIFYFSTCSIFDESLIHTPYVIHKKNMEELIEQNFNNYCIMRLPTLVGRTNNPFTFFNNFKNKLSASEDVVVHKNATRYLLDVEVLPDLISLFLKPGQKTNVINIAFDNKVNVMEIARFMKSYIHSNSILNIVEKGFDITIDNKAFLQIMKDHTLENMHFEQNYQEIIKKYIVFLGV